MCSRSPSTGVATPPRDYSLRSDGAETLQDQLPSKGTRHYAVLRRLVGMSWIASEHSDVISADGRVQLLSDANLFKSAPAAQRIWKLEQTPPAGTHVRRLPALGARRREHDSSI
jgi:hypothetical protein